MAFSNSRLEQMTRNQVPFFAVIGSVKIEMVNKYDTRVHIDIYCKGNQLRFSWLSRDSDTLFTTESKLQDLKRSIDRDLADTIGAFNNED
jgi:hypothetical protein